MIKMEKIGGTKHCCYGLCNSDSRYSYKPHMKDVNFIRFPKPWADLEKCKKWVKACGRGETFTTENVKNSTFICTKHFVGGNGPTLEHPDPIPATFTPEQVERLKRKRKPPTPRSTSTASKKLALDSNSTTVLSTIPVIETIKNDSEFSSNTCDQPVPSTSSQYVYYAEPFYKEVECQANPSLLSTAIQTDSHLNLQVNLDIRIENKILQNENKLLKSEIEVLKSKEKIDGKKLVSSESACKRDCKLYMSNHMDIEETFRNEDQLKFYTGLTQSQFTCLWNFLGATVNKLQYWNSDRENPDKSPDKRPGPRRKLSPKNELFITLIRLRMGLLHADIAYRFGISTNMVSKIIITWVQYLNKEFSTLKDSMFADREIIRQNMPKSFKKYKNIRCIIDCSEVFVQQPRNFGKQGNCYSSYKGHTTYKFLVAIAPNGAIMFISDVYEGSISDKEIVRRSEFLNFLRPGDVVMADRGFNIEDLLMPLKVKLIIPPFLGSRHQFTPQEEAKTKDIAKHRIHVERAIERMKKFRILQKTIPLNIQPVFSQMVFVIGCLVNFQEPIVK